MMILSVSRQGISLLAFFVLLTLCANSVAGDIKVNAKPRVDKVKVLKSKRKMYLYQGKDVLREYSISLGDNPIGHKQQQGDERTPEGHYVIDYRNPKSSYHLSLHINYPSAKDKKRAAAKGVNPGGDIFIHGLPNGMGKLGSVFLRQDWTDGCIAVNNQEIEEIWKLVPNGTVIEILP